MLRLCHKGGEICVEIASQGWRDCGEVGEIAS